MTDDMQRARELLAAEYERAGQRKLADMVIRGRLDSEPEIAAVSAALMTAPKGYRLVPVAATDAMVEAAADAYMPFGDMQLAIQSAMIAGDIIK